MKKYINSKLLIVAIFLVCHAKAQDTVIFADGSRVLVKIIEMDNDCVKYKKWGDENGPTWVKTLGGGISVKKGVQTMSPAEKSSLFSLCNKKQNSDTKKGDCFSGIEIAAHIDSIYSTQPYSADYLIPKYIESLPKCVNISCIQQCYLDLFNNSCDAKSKENIIKYGEIYLALNSEKDVPSVITVLAQLYAAEGLESKTQKMIKKFEAFNIANDYLFSEDINKLKKETYEKQHSWGDNIIGKWVVLNRVSNLMQIESECPVILDIESVARNNGAHIITPSQKIPKRANLKNNNSGIYNNEINTSQNILFAEDYNFSILQFSSISIKDKRWLTGLAHDFLDINRDTRARMMGEIARAKDAKIEEKLAATLVTSVATTAIDIMIKNMNTSSKTEELYTFLLYPKTPNVMNTMASYTNVTTRMTSSGGTSDHYNQFVKNKKSIMVKWEESDSVYFVSANGNPITLSAVSSDNLLLKEYYNKRKRYSLRNPAFLLPFIGGNALGAYFTAVGIENMVNADHIRDANGKRIEDEYGRIIIDDEMSKKGGIQLGLGVTTLMATNIAIILTIEQKRSKAYAEINRKNVNKLREKNAVSFMISPLYDPINNTLGATANITF